MHLNPTEHLIAVLHAIGTTGSKHEAARLQQEIMNSGKCELHLRRAELTAQHISILAPVISCLSTQSEHQLVSLSISENPHIGDQAAIALITALPPTLRELGMVSCNLTDITANHLLTWAQSAPSLKMMCIEKNNFSSQQRQNLKALSKSRAVHVYA